ncbi:MAG: helix-turn-helix domain-containing protein [Clostridiales bacterium]|nr:helix-turn-helix domain-containing protein [Clostridiales bacterium]MCM1435022.1 helix-turn-helix domain-containing protein [Ruminococcus flavefaciens]
MSIIGDKIYRICYFRGMTQKQLGVAVGFDERSADVRIAQYESGTRTPKQALVEKPAEVFDVNPQFFSNDEIFGAEGVMMLLFELDEYYPISIQDCKDEDGNDRKGMCFGSVLMTDLLSEWQKRKKDLADGKISKVEYTEWKLNWPKTTDDCDKHEPSKEWRTIKPLEMQNISNKLPVIKLLSRDFLVLGKCLFYGVFRVCFFIPTLQFPEA